MTRKFEIEYTVRATIEVADQVIDVVDDEWRRDLYNLRTPEEIIEMVARNMIQGRSLSELDGWADQPDNNAKLHIIDEEITIEELMYG